ncbi:MAG: orotidine-5'-phosphate decarboxylase [Candidatus Berkelbacteria bacterium]|nr:orotidine-5'-phosphate decarboxylase [Candidatus Berkelbacteria bacterium]
MSEQSFMQKLQAKWDEGKFVCVGLDSELAKIPDSAKGKDDERTLVNFACAIVDSTRDLVCAYKPNIAFYEAEPEGVYALDQIINHIRHVAPGVPVILDAKRGDIGNTNKGYVKAAFEQLWVDAITVSPYLGREAMQPFLDRADKGIFVLCRTSNPGAGEFQDLEVRTPVPADAEYVMPTSDSSMPVYQYVARQVAKDWNSNGNCGLVVGATYPDELRQVRKIVGDMPILIPGLGAQGGDLEATVKTGKNSRNQGIIINSSRGIIFASSGDDYTEVARHETQHLHDQITAALA